MRATSAATLPIEAPTIAPVETRWEEAVVDGLGLALLAPAPTFELLDDADEEERAVDALSD